MPSISLLLATEDAANSVLNAAVASQATDMDQVEVYTAEVKNLAALESYAFPTKFLFPSPGHKMPAYIVKFSSDNGDDLKLLDDALDHYFMVRPQESFHIHELKQKLRKRGYDVELVKRDDIYVRTRLSNGDACHSGDVDVFLGHNFLPMPGTFPALKKAFPVIAPKAAHETETVALQDGAEIEQLLEDCPGIEVFLKMIGELQKNGRKVDPPSIENLYFFKNLIDMIYVLPEKGQSLTRLDREMLSECAGSDKDVSPVITSMTYSQLLTKEGDRFKTTEDILAGVLDKL